jgi:hypothetical protein
MGMITLQPRGKPLKWSSIACCINRHFQLESFHQCFSFQFLDGARVIKVRNFRNISYVGYFLENLKSIYIYIYIPIKKMRDVTF